MPEYDDAPWGIADAAPTPAAKIDLLPAKARKTRKPAARKALPKPEPTTDSCYDPALYATI